MSGWIAIPLSNGEFFSYKTEEWEELANVYKVGEGEITVNHYTFDCLYKRRVMVLRRKSEILIFAHHSDNRPGHSSATSGYLLDTSLYDTQSYASICQPYLMLAEEEIDQPDFRFAGQVVAILERVDEDMGLT